MEVVAQHLAQITSVNSQYCMQYLMMSRTPDGPNYNVTTSKDDTLKGDIENTTLRDEGKVEDEQVQTQVLDDEDIIPNSDTNRSRPSHNSCPAIKSGEPSEKDRQQMDFLLRGIPLLGQIFELHKKIGEGTFSSVFLATIRGMKSIPFSNKQFAIKHLVPTTHPSRAERELRCLQEIGGKDNVVGVHLCLRNADCIAFVMPYLPHRRFSEYVLHMDGQETRLYMRNLLLALCRVHAFNIIHRDVKPSNFLYNRETKQFLLVDFGLSQPVEETAPPPKIADSGPPSLARKRKRCDDVEVNAFARETDCTKVTSAKLGPQCAVTEIFAKRRALQPCNRNTLNIMKTPEKLPRFQTDNKFVPSMSSARARNLQNITNTTCSGNVQKAALNLKTVFKSPPKEAVDTTGSKVTPRKTKHLAGENSKSPIKPIDMNIHNKCSFGVASIFKGNCDENRSTSRFATGFSKIKADSEARRDGLKEPPQRRILFDDLPDLKPTDSKLFTESRSASILRRSLNRNDGLKDEKGTVPTSGILASVPSPGPALATGENQPGGRGSTSGREFRTLVPDGSKDMLPGSSIVRVQNSQVKSQQRSPVTPSESRKLLMQTSREKEQQKVVFAKPRAPITAAATSHCACFGKPQVCAKCLVRKPQAAPRAGTPGFRPPEVLLRCPVQTTAVDMWAAGVILLCILSGCYPFFRAPDDLTAVAEILTIFGAVKMKEMAERLGRVISFSETATPIDFKKLCIRMRQRRKNQHPRGEDKCLDCFQVIDPDTGCICGSNEFNALTILPEDVNNEDNPDGYPDTAYHLLARLLDLNPETRITAAEALTHPFVRDVE